MNSPLKVFDNLTARCKAIMEAKNHDYRGGSGDPYANFRGSTFLGIHPVVGIMLRIQDKMMRIKTFVEKGELKVKGESIDDALMDTINYCVLIKGMLEEDANAEPTKYDEERFHKAISDSLFCYGPLVGGGASRD